MFSIAVVGMVLLIHDSGEHGVLGSGCTDYQQGERRKLGEVLRHGVLLSCKAVSSAAGDSRPGHRVWDVWKVEEGEKLLSVWPNLKMYHAIAR